MRLPSMMVGGAWAPPPSRFLPSFTSIFASYCFSVRLSCLFILQGQPAASRGTVPGGPPCSWTAAPRRPSALHTTNLLTNIISCTIAFLFPLAHFPPLRLFLAMHSPLLSVLPTWSICLGVPLPNLLMHSGDAVLPNGLQIGSKWESGVPPVRPATAGSGTTASRPRSTGRRKTNRSTKDDADSLRDVCRPCIRLLSWDADLRHIGKKDWLAATLCGFCMPWRAYKALCCSCAE